MVWYLWSLPNHLAYLHTCHLIRIEYLLQFHGSFDLASLTKE